MRDKRIYVAVGVIALFLLATLAYASAQRSDDAPTISTDPEQTTTQPPQTSTDNQTDTGSSPQVTILYTDEGFMSPSYTVEKGAVVTVKNNSSDDLEFASDDHPTHREQPELNLGPLEPGESASFTPTKAGSWKFHDHLRDQYGGTLVVTE